MTLTAFPPAIENATYEAPNGATYKYVDGAWRVLSVPKDSDGSSDVEYLDDLKDVALGSTNRARSTRDHECLWLHFNKDNPPDEIEWGITGSHILIHKTPMNGPSIDLFHTLKPGATVELDWMYLGDYSDPETHKLQDVVDKGDYFELTFEELPGCIELSQSWVNNDASFFNLGVVDPVDKPPVDDGDEHGPVVPHPPSEAASNTFLGYDYENYKWIPSLVAPHKDTELKEELDAAVERIDWGEEEIQNLSGKVRTIELEQGEQNDSIKKNEDDNVYQQKQINGLETQIQLLAATQGIGKWRYKRNISGSSPRPPASASFYATNADDIETELTDWKKTRLLMINKTDLEGTDFVFTQFEDGDKVEILDCNGTNICVGSITQTATQEAYGNIVIAVERSRGGPREDGEYLLSVHRPGESGTGIDLDVLDNRYLTRYGGELHGPFLNHENNNVRWGMDDKTHNFKGWMRVESTSDSLKLKISASNFDVYDIARFKSGIVVKEGSSAIDGDNMFGVWPTHGSYYGRMEEETDLINKGYVDQKCSSYLPLAGGTLTGTVTGKLFKCNRDSGYAFEIKPADKTLAFLHTDGHAQFNRLVIKSDISQGANRPFEIEGRLSDGTTVSKDFFYMYANNDGTPSAINYDGKMDSDNNIVNKKYVDDSKGTIRTGTSTNPSLKKGEMYLNTTNKVLYLGD